MIFTFSGTGNSFHVAKRVCNALGVEKTFVSTAVKFKRWMFDAKGEDVGFVFPVYYSGLPSMVAEFAENVEVRTPGKVFCIATCGGLSGIAGEMLQEKLGNRLKVDAFYDIEMPDNYVIGFDLQPAEKQKELLDASEVKIDEIIASIKAGEKGDFMTRKKSEGALEMYARYEEDRTTDKFWLNDRCIECRICEEVCPENVIRVYHRKPVWDEEKCSLCLSCINLCPKKAIEYGDDTAARGRYHHPDFYERILGIPLEHLNPE